MAQQRHLKKEIWFSWHPVKTSKSEWTWLKKVKRTIDERLLVEDGLEIKYSYELY